MKGSLPWNSVKGKTKAEKFRKIYQMKILYTPEKLCEGLPNEIKEFLIYCQNLNFEEEPNYDFCYSLFNRALAKCGFSNDLLFSWIKDPKILFKLKHLKSTNKSVIRLHKRKSSPQTRIYHSLRNSFEKRKSSNPSLQDSDILNLLGNETFHNKKRYIKKFKNNELLFHSLNNDKCLKRKEYIKPKIKIELHKKYRRISLKHDLNSENHSEKHLNKNILNNLTEQKQNNTFKKNIKIKNENKATIFKNNSKTLNRKLNKGLILKNSYMLDIRNFRNDKRHAIHKSIYIHNNTDIKNNSFNNNYLTKFQNSAKTKKNIIIKNIRKIQQKNKTKSKLINIIHNNIINNNINVLMNSNKENNGKQKNRIENKSGKKSVNKANSNDIIAKSQLFKLKYRPIITQNGTLTTAHKINNSKIINYQFHNTNSYLIKTLNNRTKQIKYSSITENNSFRKAL